MKGQFTLHEMLFQGQYYMAPNTQKRMFSFEMDIPGMLAHLASLWGYYGCSDHDFPPFGTNSLDVRRIKTIPLSTATVQI